MTSINYIHVTETETELDEWEDFTITINQNGVIYINGEKQE